MSIILNGFIKCSTVTQDQMKALKTIQTIFKTKTAYDLNRVVEKLAKIIRQESNKESNPREKYKSEFTDG